MNYFKKTIKYILPFGVYSIWSAIKNNELQYKRAMRLEEYSKMQTEEYTIVNAYDYEESIRILVSYNLDEAEIRSGSIPEEDLNFLTFELKRCFRDHEKLNLLHIGNFVGVSLCYIANYVRQLHVDGLVVSIDPNIEHRGIVHPEDYVKKLISYFQLDKNILLLDAFSLEKNPKNDGGVLYTNKIELKIENGCSHALINLTKISSDKFDICIIDGNHKSEYLLEEINSLVMLIKSGGLIVLDDILFWEDVKRVFDQLQIDKSFQLVASNDRIGIIKVLK